MTPLQQQILLDLLHSVNGSSFVAISTVTVPIMNKTIAGKGTGDNPHYGHITKHQTDSSVIVFQNKRQHGYNNMVKRRLVKEGKNPDDFDLSPRVWGNRIPDMPVVEHEGSLYLEVIFLTPGPVQFKLKGKKIARDRVIGIRTTTPPHQGGLKRKIGLRVIKFDSITNIKIDGLEMDVG